jgi:hypothetical protein
LVRKLVCIFLFVSDAIRTSKAAGLLGTSAVTVRSLLKTGELSGRKRALGKREVWEVDRASVEQFLALYGRFTGTRRASRKEPPRAARCDEDDPARLAAERDDLRARNVALSDALARARAAADIQARADDERAAVVRHLIEAVAGAERADDLRREAIAELQEAAAAFSRPGHVGGLESDSC